MRSRLIRVLLAVVIGTCGGDCADTPPSGTPTPIPEQTATATPTAEPDAPVAFGENVFVAVRSETSLDAPLDPANYGVSLYAGDERSGSPSDVGSLVLQSASTRTTTATTDDASRWDRRT